MIKYTHEFCEAYADRVMAADLPARLKLLWRMAETALDENEAAFPIVVGLILRTRGVYDWAEYVFQLGLRIPVARSASLFEWAVLKSLTGRPDQAIELLKNLEAEQPLNAYAQRTYAHQLSRIGDHIEAEHRLETAARLDPSSFEECVVLQQFSTFLQEFPADQALARTRAFASLYPTRSTKDIADEILQALDEDRPYSLIRVNDGEGAFLHLSMEDEAKYAALHRWNRKEWHRIIFGDERLLDDPYFLAVTRDFTDHLHEADCIAADHQRGLVHEYSWGSVRNVPCLFNVVRKLEQMHEKGQLAGKRLTFCDPQINHDLLFEGHLDRIIQKRKSVGLISTHAGLPQALAARFGLEEVIFHKTPGEQATVAQQDRTPLPDWHGRICKELQEVRPGALYLVAAGLMSKVYCQLIRRAGGVGLDIGAVADIWMRNPSRGHHRDSAVQALALVEP